MSSAALQLEIAEIKQETEAVKSLIFHLPEGLVDAFGYQAGQFLTLTLPTSEGEIRRAYSLSSCPALGEALMVSVKRQPHGRGSGYIHDVLKVGDRLKVGPPKGKFCPGIKPENHRTYYLFAAGSGITPLFSILKTVLEVEPYSHVFLFYGSRNQPSIIFKQALDILEETYPTRLKVVHILSKPLDKTWSALWKTVPAWNGLVGRIEAKQVRTWIESFPPPAQDCQYLICGPGQMIETVETTLMDLDVPRDRIWVERFGAAKSDKAVDSVVGAQLAVRFQGKSHGMTIPAGTSLLKTMTDAGLEVPYSCESGVCGTCVATLKAGKVAMRHSAALDEGERNAGKILTCQAMPASAEIAIEIKG